MLPSAKSPPQSFGPAPPQGGAKLLVCRLLLGSGWPSNCRPTCIFDSPLPFGEGDRGRGLTNPADLAATLFLTATLASNRHPLSPPDSSPSRGSKTFWLGRAKCGVTVQLQAKRFFIRFPPPLRGGGQGEGLFNHQRHRPRRRCFHQANDPLRPFGPAPPQGGAKFSDFWTSGRAGTADEKQACRYL